ncbi:MAG: hypothetical protein RLZZ141_1741 [Pseudomonadota bacterium]
MDAAASAALSPESFSALALFLRADWVVKGVIHARPLGRFALVVVGDH